MALIDLPLAHHFKAKSLPGGELDLNDRRRLGLLLFELRMEERNGCHSRRLMFD
ncbi:hypothetical protein [Mesorhizobium sp.]|uniref:hypothetical protein n=1 Tax=Mesorhizobium sp. TaxID=1871066 RepID=UPI00257E9D16|nr:hypothetical protein [Mesorhizobium sp.]